MSNAIVQRKRTIIDNYMDHEEDDNDPYMICDMTKNNSDENENESRQTTTSSTVGNKNADGKINNQTSSGKPESGAGVQTNGSKPSDANGLQGCNSSDNADSHNADGNGGTQSIDDASNKSDSKSTTKPASETNSAANASQSKSDANTKSISGDAANPQISIEVSSSKAATMSDASVNATIEQAKQSFIDSLAADVAKLEESNSVRIDNIERYLPASDNHGSFMTFMLGKFFVPKVVGNNLSMNNFINAITTFKYDSYDSPNMSITHPLSESVIYLKRLSELFDYEFLSSVSAKWKFDELDSKITTYLSQHNDLASTVLEYELIKNFMGKIAIALSTTTERAFRESRTPLVNATYRSVIAYDLAIMNQLKSENKWFASWSKFMDAFYGTGADNFVYTHESYVKLNEHLKVAYANDFLTEIMVANMLKCYFPSISLNYFYVIKCVYLIARMTTVYFHLLETNPKFKSRSLEDIMNDINVIFSVGVIIYENKNFIFKQTSHSLPTYTEDVNEKTNMYILNHLFTGGQYYLLKMFELCGPVMANMIHQRLTSTLSQHLTSTSDAK